MAAQDELFQLIKSLSPSEKRYFKTHAKKGEDAMSNYVQLFDAMDSQCDEYDEHLLKTKHSKKSFVKYLSAEKKYLREQIMKQMRAYRSDLFIDNKIHDLLQDEQFYRDKGLKAHREKAIAKAKEYATVNERYHLLQEVLEREITFVQEFEEKSLAEPVLRLHAELQKLSIVQQSYLQLSSKNREIFSAYRSGSDINDSMVRLSLDKAIAEVEMLRTRANGSFRLQQLLCKAYSTYHQIFRDAEKSYQHVLNEYALYAANPHFKELNSYNYKICLANLISRAQSANRTDEFLKYIDELKTLSATTFNEEGEVFQNVYFLEHLHYINAGEFEKAEALVPAIEEGLITYADKINKARHLTFLYNIMVMYYLMHRFKEASVWANRMLEDRSEIKQGLATATRMLLPIIHFELGHHELVENLTRAAYRYLKVKKRLHGFERTMLKYLKDMPFTVDKDEFNSNLNTLEAQLTSLSEKGEQAMAGMEEVMLWIQSHNTGKKMQALLTLQPSPGT